MRAMSKRPAKHAPLASEAASEPGLHEVLRGIADMFSAEADAKGLKLRLVLAAPDGKVAAYPLMRVTANLVSNAIKYTRKGRVLIALRRQGSGHRIEVHDTGPGLAGRGFRAGPEAQRKAGPRFGRSGGERAWPVGGQEDRRGQ